MVAVTDDAKSYDPSGDPDHIAYGKDYWWECSCGSQSVTWCDFDAAKFRGGEHEKYCQYDGSVTVKVQK